MTDFLYDNTALPALADKPGQTIASGDEGYAITAAKWTTAMQASRDLRDKFQNGYAENFKLIQGLDASGNGPEAGYYLSQPGDQEGLVDTVWSHGRPRKAGVGLSTYRWLHQDGSNAEHIVASMEAGGTFGMVGWGDFRARFESYNKDGEQNPHFRTNTFPGPGVTIEMGRNGCWTASGNLTRSGSTVTAYIPMGHVFAPGDYISLTSSDPNYPQGLETYQVATVPDLNHFTYASSGTTTPSIGECIFTTPVDAKIRSAGQKHLQVVLGDHAHEAVVVDWYADYMVTSSGYGASYGGGLVYAPIPLSSATTLAQAGHWFVCSGTWAFTTPPSGDYFAKPGQDIIITNVGSGTITVTPNTAVTLRDASGTLSTITLAQGASKHLRCDGQGTLTGNSTKDTWYVV